MAGEFTKPSSIRPAIPGQIANPDEYNQNIAAQNKDSFLVIDEDGNFIDGNLGDETIGANGALFSNLKLRQGALINVYDSSGVFVKTITFDQATESQLGTAELANQAETDAGTDDTKIVTPLKLKNSSSITGRLLSSQVFTSSGTWTKPASCNAIVVQLVGGGGGGGSSSSASSNGGTTSFGSLASATGGSAPSTFSGLGGSGGSGSLGDLNVDGGDGDSGSHSNTEQGSGGSGGCSFFGGGGKGGYTTTTAVSGGDGKAYGSGGGGGAIAGEEAQGRGGGGAGGYSEVYNSSPASSYTVTIGAGGAAGTGGVYQGGDGKQGVIIVYEYA